MDWFFTKHYFKDERNKKIKFSVVHFSQWGEFVIPSNIFVHPFTINSSNKNQVSISKKCWLRIEMLLVVKVRQNQWLKYVKLS